MPRPLTKTPGPDSAPGHAWWKGGKHAGWSFWVLAGGVALLALIGWRIAIDGLAAQLLKHHADWAIWLAPHDASGLASVASQRLEAGPPEEGDGTGALAQTALDASPLSATAIRVLARLADGENNKDRARALMQVASDRTRRDVWTEWWLVTDAMGAGGEQTPAKALAKALDHIDNILRVKPSLGVSMWPLLQRMLLVPEARDALADLLSQNPPWRPNFVGSIDASQEGVPSGAAALFERMKSNGSPPRIGETSSYLTSLFRSGQEEMAYQAWIQYLLPEERLTSLGFLYNGDFSYPVTSALFDWRFTRKATQGYSIAIRPLEPGAPARYGISVDFAGGRTKYSDIWQYLVLPPGTYRLTGDVAANLHTPRGLEWDIYCVRQQQLVAATELFRGEIPWRPFEVKFKIGEDCPGQLMNLRLAARIPSEEEIVGRVTFTNLAINRDGDP